MQKLKGTKADLDKLAAEVDRSTRVADIVQVDVGGGIHGAVPILTRGMPAMDGPDLVYFVDDALEPGVISSAVAVTRVVVTVKT